MTSTDVDTTAPDQETYTKNFPDPMEIKPPGTGSDPIARPPPTQQPASLPAAPPSPFKQLPFDKPPKGLPWDHPGYVGVNNDVPPVDQNWERFFWAIAGPESSHNLRARNPRSGAFGLLQDLPSTRAYLMRRGWGDPWAGGMQNQFNANRRWIEHDYPQAAQAIARGDYQTAVKLLRNVWPSLPGGSQNMPGMTQQFERLLGTGVPQKYFGNPYQTPVNQFGQPDYILKTAMNNPGYGMPGYMPQPEEVNQVLMSSMRGLMNMGSGRVSPLAVGMLKFWANYMAAQRAGQSELARIRKEQRDEALEDTLLKHQEEVRAYGDCLAATSDPHNPDAGDVAKLRSCLDEIDPKVADPHNDRALQRALDSPNPFGAVEALLRNRNNLWLDGSKAKATKDKKEKEPEGPDPFKADQPQQTPEQSPYPTQPKPYQQPQTATPVPQTPQQKPPEQQVPQKQTNAVPGSENTMSQLATNIGMGVEPLPAGKDERTQQDYTAAEAEATRRLAQIQRDVSENPNLKPEDIVPAVKRINATWGNDLQDMIDFGPTGSRSGTSASPRALAYQEIMRRLAARADPDWSPTRAGNLTEFKDANKATQRTLGRATNMYQAGLQVAEDLQRLKEAGAKVPQLQTKIVGGIATWAGDPKYTGLYNDWFTYQQELNALTRGGAESVTETQERKEQIPWFSSAAQFRNALSHDAGVANSRLDHYTTLYRRMGGKGQTWGIDPVAQNGLHHFQHMDENSGVIRGSAVFPDTNKPPVVGQAYAIGKKVAVWTGGGDITNLTDPNNWEEY